ncbi:hypothetical protein CDO28_20230 (plasmid) [Sinorhizobium meliloti]|uniref:hypothetical protein n=1 Tax=Rhizobium meliloti TaxID=382 RepID=UPI000B4A1F3E|nr:hypothetical protein [Sinorhizobium meliloti]ASP73876.1 hypothetical protein CDO28_20230 [Sinorhizobium meliloti]MDE3858127.1 hypothetical protein [Sinorhizobium meliloti]MQW48358.1 hypothetical protein [Sinorhizobium meliloti]
MTTKLSRDAILREMLVTLVKGWGPKAVYEALDEVVGNGSEKPSGPQSLKTSEHEPTAVQLIEALSLVGERRELLIRFAQDFDAGSAFPKLGDIRAFLASHHRVAKDLRSRGQGFRKMVPLLVEMSEKGLAKVISRSQYSGPADLEAISDAIKGAGENLRGDRANGDTSGR